MEIIYLESLGLDGRTLSILRRHGIERVARLVDSVRKGELGNLSQVGNDRLNEVINALKSEGLIEREFDYKAKFVVRKEKKHRYNYSRVSGSEAMPFLWQNPQGEGKTDWDIEVEGWATLLFHKPIAAYTLIAIYECVLEDVLTTKENVHERFKEVCARFGAEASKSPTTTLRQLKLLENFHIDGVHNPFVIRKGDQASHRVDVDDTHIMGRGGEAGSWTTVMSYPRMPIGAVQRGSDFFEVTAILTTESGFIVKYQYKGEKVRNDIRKQRPTANVRANAGGDSLTV